MTHAESRLDNKINVTRNKRIGYICSAITDFVVTFADDSNIVNLHNWSMGSFASSSWQDLRAMSIVVFPVLIGTFDELSQKSTG